MALQPAKVLVFQRRSIMDPFFILTSSSDRFLFLYHIRTEHLFLW